MAPDWTVAQSCVSMAFQPSVMIGKWFEYFLPLSLPQLHLYSAEILQNPLFILFFSKITLEIAKYLENERL